MDLSSKHVVVTGASRGIGAAIANALLNQGARVSVWSRTALPSEQDGSTKPNRAYHVACDIRSADEVNGALDATLKMHGPITGCVANAGIRPGASAMGTCVDVAQDAVYRTNVIGTFQTLRAVADSMITMNVSDGRLLALGSLAGSSGSPGHIPYAMSKAAVSAMIKSLALELAPHGITANLLVPGWIETTMNQDVIENRFLYESIKRVRIPLKRWGRPEDLAGICTYLMSSSSRYHTGDTITVDGGYSLF